MNDNIRRSLNLLTGPEVSDADFAVLAALIRRRMLRKKQFLLYEGIPGRDIYYVVKGALRKYSIDSAGTEHVSDLALEDAWMLDAGGIFRDAPSAYYIEALEDSEIMVLPADEIRILAGCTLYFSHLSGAFALYSYLALETRMKLLQHFTAIERVAYLMEYHPVYFHRFPQNILAAYIGITPATFCRERKRLLKGRSVFASSLMPV
ncbi:CRP-like cAMP-binding protein [Filimonas zeae]|nr:Crp/Fnr family transcriptional regulator [Filimonas zeae]MDR6339243.1 CRP-like cAMP-binding protein [Filimonas zeae]